MIVLKKILTFFFIIYAKYTLGNWHAKIRANGFTRLSRQTEVGQNVHFNGFKIYGKGNCKIGNNFHSGFGCIVVNSFHNYNGEALPYDNTNINKEIIIEDNVWLGVNVTLLGGCHIEEGAIIQAGSVVSGKISKCAIAGGHPAREFSKRNIKKYEELKAKKMFN